MHPEGQITVERQVDGPRKGQWLFNQATVRSVDRLYNAFESEPILPELVAAGRSGSGPSFRHEPGSVAAAAPARLAEVPDRTQQSLLDRRVSAPRGDPVLAPGRARLQARRRSGRAFDQATVPGPGRSDGRCRGCRVGPPDRLAGRGLAAHRGGDAAQPADGARGRLPRVPGSRFLAPGGAVCLPVDHSDSEAGRRSRRSPGKGRLPLPRWDSR